MQEIGLNLLHLRRVTGSVYSKKHHIGRSESIRESTEERRGIGTLEVSFEVEASVPLDIVW
jgi:hypothetical protein